MSPDWLLEYDNDGEIYTDSDAVSWADIERRLVQFDGVHTFYCGLSRSREDDVLRCYGEPDRRIIEGIVVEEGGLPFVLRKAGPVGGRPIRVKYGTAASESLLVDPSEVLTLTDAITLFAVFWETQRIPPPFVPERKVYLFG